MKQKSFVSCLLYTIGLVIHIMSVMVAVVLPIPGVFFEIFAIVLILFAFKHRFRWQFVLSFIVSGLSILIGFVGCITFIGNPSSQPGAIAILSGGIAFLLISVLGYRSKVPYTVETVQEDKSNGKPIPNPQVKSGVAEKGYSERKDILDGLFSIEAADMLDAPNTASKGRAFEEYCAKILEYNSFTAIELTSKTADRGGDIIAWKGNHKYLFQCKCFKSKIGNHAVQEAYSAKKQYAASEAIVLTNSFFTPQAILDAEELGVLLWDRDKLGKMIEYANYAVTKSST